MTDMLVKLYTLPPLAPALEKQRADGVDIRRPLGPEKHLVLNWIGQNFYPHWASEGDVAFARTPISCFIAVEQGQIIGFACYDTTCLNFFGPTGVGPAARGRGTGTALLLAALHAMHEQGYGYAIIGDVGPVDYYAKTVGAVVIADSTPGVYAGLMRSA
jgi:GNAT superfamily N-acetyltransferase